MEILKRLTTFLTIMVFTVTGVPVSSIASEGDEESGAFEDPNAVEETEEDSDGAAAIVGGAAAGLGAGVWVAITGAILGVFSGGSSEFTTPSGNPPVTPPA